MGGRGCSGASKQVGFFCLVRPSRFGRRQQSTNLQFTVFVYNDADAPEALSIEAEQDAGDVFAKAGLQAAFVNCMTGERMVDAPEYGPMPAPGQLVVPVGSKISDLR